MPPAYCSSTSRLNNIPCHTFIFTVNTLQIRWEIMSGYRRRKGKEQHKFYLGIVISLLKPCWYHPIYSLIPYNCHLPHCTHLPLPSPQQQCIVYSILAVTGKNFMRIYNPPFLLWFPHLAVLSAPWVQGAPVPPVEQNRVISVSLHQRPLLLGHSQVCIVFSEDSVERGQVGSCIPVVTDLKKSLYTWNVTCTIFPLSHVILQFLTN